MRPSKNVESAFPLFPFEPLRRNLSDLPTHPVAFHEQFDAVRESRRRFDRDRIQKSLREKPEPIRGVVRGNAGQMIKQKRCDTDRNRLLPATPDHPAPRHEPAGGNKLAPFLEKTVHGINKGGIVDVVARKNQDRRGTACTKAFNYRGVRAAAGIPNEFDPGQGTRMGFDGGQCRVFLEVVADKNPERRPDLPMERFQNGKNLRSLIKYGNHDIESGRVRHTSTQQPRASACRAASMRR